MHTDTLSGDQSDPEDLKKAKKRLFQLLLEEEGLGDLDTDAIMSRTDATEPVASFAQERLCFLSQWNTQNCLYNIPVSLHVRGHLQVGALEQSLNEIVQRHEVLRHAFVTDNGRLKLKIVSYRRITIPLIHLEDTSPAEQKMFIQTLLQSEANQPFDLAQGPFLRPVLLQIAPEEHIFSLVFHHIAFDDWSGNIFLRDLSTLYASFCMGKRPYLPALPVRYMDFASW